MGTKSFSIDAVFRAVDKMSNPMRGITKNTSKLSRAIRTDFAKAQRSVDQFSKNFKRNLAQNVKRTIVGVGLSVAVGLGFAAKEYVDFENTITASSAKFGESFQKNTAGFQKLTDATRKIGATTEFTSTQAAKGLDFLALAGFNAVQSMTLLPGVVDLATAAQTDLATASDIASDSLGAFGLMTKDSTQLGINFNRVMDTMAKTTTTSNTDLVTLFETVKKGGAAFTSSGQSIETFNALAGKLANAGLKGAESGTFLRNMMLRIAKPTGEASALMKKMNINVADSKGNFRDVLDIIGDFEKGLKGLGTQQRSAALKTIFGDRSITGMNLVLKEGSQSLRNYRLMLENSAGAARLMADVMRGSLGNQIATLKSAALELGFKFVEAFEEQGVTGIQSLTTAINNFNVVPVLESIDNIISVISTLAKIIIPIAPIILGIAGAFFVYTTALKLAAIAQGLLNAAIAGNPIGLIIVGIGLLIGLVVILVKNFDAISPVLKNVGKGIMTLLLSPINFVIDAIGGLLLLMSKIPGVGKLLIPALDALGSFQDNMNKITFSTGILRNEKERTQGQDQFGFAINPADQQITQPPISSAERGIINREESTERIQLDINDPDNKTTVKRNPANKKSNIKLKSSGGL